MVGKGIDSFIEFGSKEVLCGLIKRIDRKTIRIPLGSPEDFEKLNI
jgi:malonyl CoA-acyl carrier protein transacylase